MLSTQQIGMGTSFNGGSEKWSVEHPECPKEPQSGRDMNKCILLTIAECILRPPQVETAEENTSLP